MEVKLRYIKIHPDRYRLECLRADGAATSAELEMRGFLKHDLMHFVVEDSAKLSHSFYGSIARGVNLEELSPKAMKESDLYPEPEGQTTEIIVASLQGVENGTENMPERVKKISEYLTLMGLVIPKYFTPEFGVEAVKAHRTLMERWRSLQIGSMLELTWSEN